MFSYGGFRCSLIFQTGTAYFSPPSDRFISSIVTYLRPAPLCILLFIYHTYLLYTYVLPTDAAGIGGAPAVCFPASGNIRTPKEKSQEVWGTHY